MKPFILLLFTISFNLSFSQGLIQGNEFSSNSRNIDLTSELNIASRGLPKLNTVVAKGSPYINSKYTNIKIRTFENMVFSGRYNANNGNMEVITREGAMPIALDIEKRDYEVTFLNTKKTYKSFKYKNKKGVYKKDFFVDVSPSKNGISLLKKEYINFIPEKLSTSSYEKNQPAKFKRIDDIFYIIKPKEESLTLLPKNKKDIAKLFSSREKEILSYIKKEKIKLSKEEDLIKLVNFLNQ